MSQLFSAVRMRRSRSFLRLTGVSVATFDRMLTELRLSWDAKEVAKLESVRPSGVGRLEDHFLLMLVYYRCYVTQEFIGFFYPVDRSAICRAIKWIERHARRLNAVPKMRNISKQEAEALIVDCTEQSTYRPHDAAEQKADYSGKKKRHTLKTELIVTAAGSIAGVSKSHPGSKHDLTIRREGGAAAEGRASLRRQAYQGYGREHSDLEIPYKKPKSGELDEQEKGYKRGPASFRVGVEHQIGGTKRFRIVSDRFRSPGKPTTPRPRSSPGSSISPGFMSV